MEPQQAPEQRDEVKLHPLTPKYQPENHATYFHAIKDALSWSGDDTVRNLALTGSYGVGKSSILRQVATDEDLKVVQVSLSTLGFEVSPSPSAAEAKSGGDDADKQANPLRETKTNQIQKEIVKQLLYTQMPEKMPGSRYKRTSAFRPIREAAIALSAGIPIALAFFLLGWTAKIAALFTVPSDWAIAANAGMAVASAAFVYGVRHLTHNKLRIDSVSAGAATIKLSAASDTYFDEYLDEIVYFFEVADYDVVIFEDIDRFEDAHIFETLRELNTILNTAKQLEGRAIRFLYAIKDSIFEELGTRAAREAASGSDTPKMDAATVEVARANRTKFFDLVIPVVPFVTHQSARELMTGELEDLRHAVSDDLVDLVAQHVPDMRLIKNIRNEFVIFRQQVIGRSSLQLTEDALFAMVLYKSTHLSDFEQIKLGKSSIDDLYRDSRTLVANETSRLNAHIQDARRRLRNGTALAERSKSFGNALEGHINDMLGHFSTRLISTQYEAQTLTPADLRGAAFWTKYASDPKPLTISYRHPWNGYNESTTIAVAEVERAVGERMGPKQWESVGQVEAEKRIASSRDDIEFLRRADMSDLMGRRDLQLRRDAQDPIAFSDHAAKLLGSQLAVALVEQGYIDRYFTLYTSTFVGTRVNANAMNFILKNVDTGTADFYFPLTVDEIKAVLRERPRLALREKSAYNFDFLDYVLRHDAAGSATILGNLRRHGDEEKQFLQAYLSSDRDLGKLVRGLAAVWRDVLTYVAAEADVDDERRLSAFDAALAGLSDDVEYAVSEDVVIYLDKNHAALSAFTSPDSAAAARRIAGVVDAADLLVADLAVLSDQARKAIVAAERFAVTRSNLLIAIRPSTSLSLDGLKKASPAAYRRAVSDLARYLDALEAEEATVADPSEFVPIIEDVAKADRASLDAVVGRAADECRVAALDSVGSSTWRALAAHARFPADFANVAAYTEEFGIDEKLAVVLATGSIAVAQDLGEEPRVELARKLLRSADALPSPDVRASLLRSLKLPHYLPAEEVPEERGQWIGRLIEQDVIKDDADSFALIASDDWTGLEYAISTSSELPTFIAPQIIPANVMVRFLDSAVVPPDLKKTVVGRFVEFSDGADRSAVNRMLRFALDNGVSLQWDAVERAARSQVDNSLVLKLLQRFNSSVTLEHLRPVLSALGGDYAKLLERNGLHPKFPNAAEHRALLERMRELGTVSTIKEHDGTLKANMGRP